MAGLADRLAMLVELRRENRQILRANAQDAEQDRNGSCTSSLAIDLRFFGVADYCLNDDVQSFRTQLAEAAQLRLRLFERFEGGEPIDGSYVTMLSYKAVFDGLAAGDMKVAAGLAAHMGGRDALEREHDHPFDYVMGYALRACVLNDTQQMRTWTPQLAEACGKPGQEDFRGYADVFQAILSHDAVSAGKGVNAIVTGHRRQCKGKGVFVNTPNEVLCIWGIGMANLARSYGVRVEAVPPLIPEDLLI